MPPASFGRQWRALVGKNALLLRRHACATVLDVVLPALFAIVMVAVWATGGVASSPTVQYGAALRQITPLGVLGGRLALSGQALAVAPATDAARPTALGLLRFLQSAYPALNGSQVREGLGLGVGMGAAGG